MARIAAALAFLAALIALALPAFAFTPPPLHGHVVDTSGALSPDEIAALDAKLDNVARRTGYEIVAFVPGSLQGETIADVAYETFNTWHVGQKGKDNGVLLVIAPHERRVRIETGAGVEGPLTDLQSDDILLHDVVPALKDNRVYDAIDQGTTAIARTLAGEPGAVPRAGHRSAPPARAPPSITEIGVAVGGIVLLIVLSILFPGLRSFLWFLLGLFIGGGRGGGGGGSGSGGSGYSGGGGRSGGGGASEDY